VQEKVVGMNRGLQRELRESERKIMELEREVQRSVCHTQQENIAKIKESTVRLKDSALTLRANKENTRENNPKDNPLKSLERKKQSASQGQIRKTGVGRAVSSATLTLARKLMTKPL
jgi:hypothetical protein